MEDKYGKVKWYNQEKGFGFITPDDGGKDVFVHHSEVEGGDQATLQDEQEVVYVESEGQKGPAASNVRATKSASLPIYFDLDTIDASLAVEVIKAFSEMYGEPLEILSTQPMPPGTDLLGARYRKAG